MRLKIEVRNGFKGSSLSIPQTLEGSSLLQTEVAVVQFALVKLV